jgi:ribosomal protein L25 (general stress protein Ctc)
MNKIPRVCYPPKLSPISSERALKNILKVLEEYGWDSFGVRPDEVQVAIDDCEALLMCLE